jgi:D-alanyl-lipoteichoic acid acyltransferase DltB (MBOAT superfamily)
MTNFITEKILHFFVYDQQNPLVLTQIDFWIFYTVVYGLFTVFYKQYNKRNLFLFLVSLFYYYKVNNLFFLLLIFSITSDYFVARKMDVTKEEWKRKLMLLYSVIMNLGLLSYFKYAYFFTDSYNTIFHTDNKVFNYFAHWSNSTIGTHFSVDNIIFPVGISFYTFQILSYTIDVYKRKIKPLNDFVAFGFYASFFPQVLIGPIVKARDFIPQLYKPFNLNGYQFGLAMFMILNGLIKKLVVGDYIAVNFIDRVYANPLLFSGVENVLSVIAYSMYVYLDFSGYTDVAIGIAQLLGFKLTTNFNSPYKAKNVGEFWKRWHISLSSWLQEYLYIPLGGNRKGTIASYIIIAILTIFLALLLKSNVILWIVGSAAFVLAIISLVSPPVKNWLNTNINLMITMLLGGLWHGATLNFIIWGGLNGLGLMVSKLWRKISPYEKIKSWPVHAWKVFNTFMFITFTRIYFRAEDMNQAKEVMDKISSDTNWTILPIVLDNFKEVFLLLLLAFIVHWLPTSVKWEYKKYFIKSPVWLKVTFVLLTFMMIYRTMTSEMKAFIYFQF